MNTHEETKSKDINNELIVDGKCVICGSQVFKIENVYFCDCASINTHGALPGVFEMFPFPAERGEKTK